jgi:Ca-activated chloride channel family protein
VARPSAIVTLPSDARTVVMAMDVSLSMRATDVDPSRIVAAQNAAKEFVKELPADIKAGIVTFAGTAVLVQPPTHNREDLIAAIDRFELQRHTAIGSGIIVSLAALFPDQGIDVGELTYGAERRGGKPDKAGPPAVKPVPPGSYASGVIILLTDGQRTTGPDPIDAAKMAADRGVKVYTVGVGTKEGDTIGFEGWSMRVRLDEETLKQVSSATRAEYFYAGTALDLKRVYQSLGSRLSAQKKETEISALFAAAGALLTLLAAGLSIWWFGRVA